MDFTDFEFLNALLPGWVSAALIALCCTFLLLIIKGILLRRLNALAASTPYYYDSLLISSAALPLTLIIVLLNLYWLDALLHYFDVSTESTDRFLTPLTRILLIAAGVWFIDRFCVGLFQRHIHHSEILRSSHGILSGLLRGLILGLGALVLLGTLGISITPLIASLGISSLAVALALQPTLANFFSGVQLIMDKPIRVGDYIELDSGEQGFVERIGWRSTWIKMLPNNTLIMPNSVLSESRIINYFYPEKELSVPVEVGVHYDSDLEFVEQITLEVAREILRSHKWGVDTYETFVVFHTFDDSSINFTVMLRAQEYFNRFFIKSEFIKALHKRFREEGIVIPYPIRALNTQQEQPRFDVQQPPMNKQD